MSYTATPEQIQASKRVDEERLLRCQKINLRYELAKKAKINEAVELDKAKKQKAVIAFQTGRKMN